LVDDPHTATPIGRLAPVSNVTSIVAILVAVCLLAAIQIVALTSPLFLPHRVKVADSSVVAYRIARSTSRRGGGVKVTLYSTRPLRAAPQLLFVTSGGYRPPYVSSSPYGSPPTRWTKTVVTLRALVPTGIYRLWFGRGDPFGYVNVQA
jgi:hypothetical protein